MFAVFPPWALACNGLANQIAGLIPLLGPGITILIDSGTNCSIYANFDL
jgi:hypothetical protein